MSFQRVWQGVRAEFSGGDKRRKYLENVDLLRQQEQFQKYEKKKSGNIPPSPSLTLEELQKQNQDIFKKKETIIPKIPKTRNDALQLFREYQADPTQYNYNLVTQLIGRVQRKYGEDVSDILRNLEQLVLVNKPLSIDVMRPMEEPTQIINVSRTMEQPIQTTSDVVRPMEPITESPKTIQALSDYEKAITSLQQDAERYKFLESVDGLSILSIPQDKDTIANIKYWKQVREKDQRNLFSGPVLNAKYSELQQMLNTIAPDVGEDKYLRQQFQKYQRELQSIRDKGTRAFRDTDSSEDTMVDRYITYQALKLTEKHLTDQLKKEIDLKKKKELLRDTTTT